MFSLKKESGLAIQTRTPVNFIIKTSAPESPFIIGKKNSVSMATASGRLIKIHQSSQKSRMLASSVSEDRRIISALFSDSKIIIWNVYLRNSMKLSCPFDCAGEPNCTFKVMNSGRIILSSYSEDWVWLPDDMSSGNWQCLKEVPSNIFFCETVPPPSTLSALTITCVDNMNSGYSIGISKLFLYQLSETLSCIESSYKRVAEDFQYTEYKFKTNLEYSFSKYNSQVISKFDYQGFMLAVALNSSHSFFCQILFLNPLTGKTVVQKLAQYVTMEDIPTSKESGVTSFWVDDMAWTPSDSFLAVFLKSKHLTIITRCGEAVYSVIQTHITSEPKIFSELFFSTDPNKAALGSIDWKDSVVLSDGFTVIDLTVDGFPIIEDLINLYLPHDDLCDLSINISHDTHPLPSELDVGPKRKKLERALLFLRSVVSNRLLEYQEEAFSAICRWLENVMPPQLHEEINYTVMPAFQFQVESRMASNLTLKKKVLAVEIYGNYLQLFHFIGWMPVELVEYDEWFVCTTQKVLLYTIADQQALYTWSVLRLFENWLGSEARKMRLLYLVHALNEYRNPQANKVNVVYFVIAFLIANRSTTDEIEFLRDFLKDKMELRSQMNPTDKITYFSSWNKFSDTSRSQHLDYLLDKEINFEDKLTNFCVKLANRLTDELENYLSLDTILIYAYYLDPYEPYFISPLEVQFYHKRLHISIKDLLNLLRARSRVPVEPMLNLETEAGFLYWNLAQFDKVKMCLPPELAFLAINEILELCELQEAIHGVKVLSEIFTVENCSTMSELAHSALKMVYKTIGLALIRNKLKNSIETNRFLTQECLVTGFESLVNSELIKLVEEFSLLIYPCSITPGSLSWIEMEEQEEYGFSQITSQYLPLLQEVLFLLWEIKVKSNYAAFSLPNWGLRLLPFNSTHLNVLLDNCRTHEKLVKIYLFKTIKNAKLAEKYFEDTELAEYREHPWLEDPDFYKFCQIIIRKPQKSTSKVSKLQIKWTKMTKKYRKKFKIQGRVILKDGSFTYFKNHQSYPMSDLAPYLEIPKFVSVEKENDIQKVLSQKDPIRCMKARSDMFLFPVKSHLVSSNKKILCEVTSVILLSKMKKNMRSIFSVRVSKRRASNPGLIIAPVSFQFYKAHKNQKIVIASSLIKLPIMFIKGGVKKTRKSRQNAFKLMRIPNKGKTDR